MSHVVRSFQLEDSEFEHLFDSRTQSTSLRACAAPPHSEPLLTFTEAGLVHSPQAAVGRFRLEVCSDGRRWTFYPAAGGPCLVLEANRLDAEVSVSRSYLAHKLALVDSEGGCCD